jgi:ubiquitin-like 1-activating enzyme E1 A
MELSEEEAKVYDRQLRMWGVEAQQRMRSSRVLIVGIQATAAEICKNLVLTGIGSLVVLDDQTVTNRDLPGQFFLTRENVGQKMTEASLEAIRALNPHVTVTAHTACLDEKADEFFLDFDLICLTNCSRARQLRINAVCRAASRAPALFCVTTLGLRAYCVADLGARTFSKKEMKKRKREEEVVSVTKTYVSLEAVFSTRWESVLQCFGRLKAFAAVFIADQAICIAREENKNASFEQVLNGLQRELKDQGLPDTTVPEQLLREVFESRQRHISPVCAVFGGIIGGEVLKILSGKDEPLDNLIVYDSTQNSAVVRQVPAVVRAESKVRRVALEF